MQQRSAFVEHVVETLKMFGPVEARAMFGGWGLYHQGLFFALVAQDTLYFKSDDKNEAEYLAQKLAPWVFTPKKGESIVTRYYAAPEEALESPAVMARWAKLGYGAALRAAAAKARKAPAPRRKRAVKQRS